MSGGPMWRRIQRFLGADPDADIEDEVRHHLEMRESALRARGLTAEEARVEALRRFGDVEAVRREVVAIDREAERKERRSAWVTDLRQDFRYGVRVLRRGPGFTITAVGILALAIGANVAVFSAVNGVLLKPLPFADPNQLVMLWEENPERGWYRETAAPANVFDWRERVDAFEDIGFYVSFPDPVTVIADADPVALTARSVSGNLFSVLGVAPAAGRLLTEEETWSTSEAAVVLGHESWVSVFGADPAVIGTIARLNGTPYRIVGVAPEGFRIPGVEADLWRSIRFEPGDLATASFRRAHYVRPIARLRTGVTIDQAQARLAAVAVALESEYPETNQLMGAGLTPLHEFLVGDVSLTLKLLLGAVALLLLLAVANVGNLLLVRALSRRRELAVRAALGAGRGRLVRQMLVENAVLSVLAAVAGVGVGWLFLRMYSVFGAAGLVADVNLALDHRLLAYLLAIVVAGGLVFTLAPLLAGARTSLNGTLGEGGRHVSGGRPTRRAANALVAGEIAISLLLLSGAILLARSFAALQRVEPGFESGGVFTGGISLPAATYDTDERVVAFFDELVAEVEALPGVERAAVVRQLPLTGASWTSDFSVAGRPPEDYGIEAVHREATPGYFETMRVPLIAGRTFTSGDRIDSERVIVINETLARRYFPGENPLGQRVAFTRAPDENTIWRTIVGVVGAEIQGSPAEGARIEIFTPLSQAVTRNVELVVRTDGPPSSLALPVSSLVRGLDPGIVLVEPVTMDEVREAATARERFVTMLVTAFAGVALALAVAGVYGVVAQSLRGRRREMAVRTALGATRADLVAMTTLQSLPMLVVGITLGVAGALFSSRFAASLTYGVEPDDPATLVLAALLLLTMGLVATTLSSARAVSSRPSAVLREE